MKRLFDIFSSSFALLLLSPLLVLIALLIILTSPGPALFKQKRVGLGRREFLMIKFRSMRLASEKSGPLVTAGGDLRVTLIGKVLRATKLDELPELWNVIKGDLSIVGPRPEVPRYVAHYRPEWEPVFSVRPGITDLATLQFRHEEDVLAVAKDQENAYINVVLPIKMDLALSYVRKRSFFFDLKLIFLTVWGITFGRFFARPDSTLAAEAVRRIESLNSH